MNLQETQEMNGISVRLIGKPSEDDWMGVKERALVTVGKHAVNKPTSEWKHKILEARHSPIRYLRYSFYLEVPYYLSVHLCRHVHIQPYVKSQRNDRQSEYDRTKAPQDAPVSMILDLNAESLMVIANKRLCMKADPMTRKTVGMMCMLAEEATPELKGLLVPMCEYCHGCHEMQSCGLYGEKYER